MGLGQNRSNNPAAGDKIDDANGNAQNNVPQYTIPGILHFIEHEWQRFQAERSQWDTDRAELQVRSMVHSVAASAANFVQWLEMAKKHGQTKPSVGSATFGRVSSEKVFSPRSSAAKRKTPLEIRRHCRPRIHGIRILRENGQTASKVTGESKVSSSLFRPKKKLSDFLFLCALVLCLLISDADLNLPAFFALAKEDCKKKKNRATWTSFRCECHRESIFCAASLSLKRKALRL